MELQLSPVQESTFHGSTGMGPLASFPPMLLNFHFPILPLLYWFQMLQTLVSDGTLREVQLLYATI